MQPRFQDRLSENSKPDKPIKRSVANIRIHPSQFPERVRDELIESLRSRQINHKFHYDSLRQVQKWFALHETYSPARKDPDCLATYDRSFAATVSRISANQVDLISLACGGGQKEARLLEGLNRAGKKVSYTPCDTSLSMVLVARAAALAMIPANECFPLVCDLANAEELLSTLDEILKSTTPCPDRIRLFTAFGILPNFEPGRILPKLAALVQPKGLLLLSANLAPGADYESGVQHVLHQYDNSLTRDWLTTFLFDLGVEKEDGYLEFSIENDPAGLGPKRIAAHYRFQRTRQVHVDDNRLKFEPGEAVRLFFSYRYTSDLLSTLLNQQGLHVLDQWVSCSEEEGVFLIGGV